jgi:hypothetical protein
MSKCGSSQPGRAYKRPTLCRHGRIAAVTRAEAIIVTARKAEF